MVIETGRDRIERRRGPDFWVKLINWAAVGAWIMMLIGLYLFEKAKPRFSTFFDRFFGVPIATGWDYELIKKVMLVMLGAAKPQTPTYRPGDPLTQIKRG